MNKVFLGRDELRHYYFQVGECGCWHQENDWWDHQTQFLPIPWKELQSVVQLQGMNWRTWNHQYII